MTLTNNQLCRLGETAVALELMKRGYDVINLNESLKNYKGADLLCVNGAGSKEDIYIQVKTGKSPKIDCGLTADPKTGVIANLDEKVTCPWVFVHVTELTTVQGNNELKFDFYILTCNETRELLRSAHHWYVKETYSGRVLSKPIRVSVDVPWLEAKGYNATKLHKPFTSTLKQSAKDQWDKIWL